MLQKVESFSSVQRLQKKWKKPEIPSNLKTNYCKFCYGPLSENSFTYLFRSDFILCNKCFRSFNPIFRKFQISGIKGVALYEYTEKFAAMLFQFKGCYDYELAPLFLDRVRFYLKLQYHNYILVPAPSTEESNKKRGFNHVQEIFKILNRPIVDCIFKTGEIKQSDKGHNRKEIKKYLDIRNGDRLRNQNVLLVDDVKTTGSTLKAMVELVKKYNPRRLNILVLSMTIPFG